MYLIILLHVLYGATFTISKILVQHANPIFVIGLRMIIAGTLLTGFAKIIKREKVTFDNTTIWYILQIAIFGIFFPYVLRYWALSYLPVTKTALMYNLSPFAAFFFSYLFFGERATFRKWIGLTVGVLGILPVLIVTDQSDKLLPGVGFFSWPELAMIVSVICFSYGWVIMKKLMHHSPISPAYVNGINMLIGGVLASATSLVLEPSCHIDNPVSFGLWLALIILITNIICYNLYASLLRKYSATLLSLAGLLAPVSAALTSWLYFGETLNWAMYLSGGLVIFGFLLFYSEELRLGRENGDIEEKIDI